VPAVNKTEIEVEVVVQPLIVGCPGATSEITIVKEFVEAVAPLLSVIVAITAKEPVALGVPEIWQLNPLWTIDKPPGRAPEVIAQAVSEFRRPPDAVNVKVANVEE
jgi:hypothetical protein